MKFSVTANYTISGWIEIEADNISEAYKKAMELNDSGFSLAIINDREDHSEVFTDELFPLGDE